MKPFHKHEASNEDATKPILLPDPQNEVRPMVVKGGQFFIEASISIV